jgi:competence protein ComFC
MMAVDIIESAIGSPCALCGADARFPSGGRGLCLGCHSSLPWIGSSRCGRCGRPLATGSDLCIVCRENPPAFDSCRSLWAHEGPAKALLRAFKYGRDLRPLPFFATELIALAKAEGWGNALEAGINGSGIITAVPADARRKALRGWDPVSVLASALRGSPCLDLLRKKSGKEQKKLNLEERLAYPAGKIRLCGRISPHGDIILIDDVVTSGATLSECARVLKAAGAGKIRCLTLVREL